MFARISSIHRLGLSALVAGLGLVSVQSAQAVGYFDNPQSVNLLERWSPDGRYYFDPLLDGDGVGAGDNLTYVDGLRHQAIADYAPGGSGYLVFKPASGETKTASMTWTFDAPVTIDKLTTTWRAENHSTDNYIFRDQNGTPLVTYAPGSRFPGGTISHTITPATITALTFETVLDNTTGDTNDPAFYHLMENNGIGAFLAAGEVLAMDGTYNILHQPHTQSGDVHAAWSDHLKGSNGEKPNGAANSTTFNLDQMYLINGFFQTHYDSGRFLANMIIEGSRDGVHFNTLYGPDSEYHFRSEAFPNELGYITLPSVTNANYAQYVRLSWSNNNSPVELTEFQIFATVPEPASASLLALGSLMMMGRRRQR